MLDEDERTAKEKLRREWFIYFLGGASFLLSGFFLLWQEWGLAGALRWLAVAGAILIYLFVYLWKHLDENRPNTLNAGLFSNLGLANGITIVRAVFVAALAGFLVGPKPTAWLAWAPSMLYLVSSVMDYLDGYAARVSGRMTILGEALDMKWDGTGMLAAVTLSVLYGQTPVPYLLVGLARYLYLAGIWLHERRGQPVYDLPPSRFRRALAGSQMGFVAVILMPVYEPPETHIAAVLFMLPMLVGFLRDFLWVTGHISQPASQPPSRWQERMRTGLPLALRAALVLLLASLLSEQLLQAVPNPGIFAVSALALPALLLGAAGRVFALAVLLMTGFGLQISSIEWRYWVILILSTALFMTGTGRYSLWKPEEWLIYHRAGEVSR